jgi:hypothetical protein
MLLLQMSCKNEVDHTYCMYMYFQITEGFNFAKDFNITIYMRIIGLVYYRISNSKKSKY